MFLLMQNKILLLKALQEKTICKVSFLLILMSLSYFSFSQTGSNPGSELQQEISTLVSDSKAAESILLDIRNFEKANNVHVVTHDTWLQKLQDIDAMQEQLKIMENQETKQSMQNKIAYMQQKFVLLNNVLKKLNHTQIITNE